MPPTDREALTDAEPVREVSTPFICDTLERTADRIDFSHEGINTADLLREAARRLRAASTDAPTEEPDDPHINPGDRINCTSCGGTRFWGSACAFCWHSTDGEIAWAKPDRAPTDESPEREGGLPDDDEVMVRRVRDGWTIYDRESVEQAAEAAEEAADQLTWRDDECDHLRVAASAVRECLWRREKMRFMRRDLRRLRQPEPARDRELALGITSVVDHADWLISRVRAHASGELNVEVGDAIDELRHSVGWLQRAWVARSESLQNES